MSSPENNVAHCAEGSRPSCAPPVIRLARTTRAERSRPLDPLPHVVPRTPAERRPPGLPIRFDAQYPIDTRVREEVPIDRHALRPMRAQRRRSTIPPGRRVDHDVEARSIRQCRVEQGLERRDRWRPEQPLHDMSRAGSGGISVSSGAWPRRSLSAMPSSSCQAAGMGGARPYPTPIDLPVLTQGCGDDHARNRRPRKVKVPFDGRHVVDVEALDITHAHPSQPSHSSGTGTAKGHGRGTGRARSCRNLGSLSRVVPPPENAGEVT